MQRKIQRLTQSDLTAHALSKAVPEQKATLERMLERNWRVTKVTEYNGVVSIGACLQDKAAWITASGHIVGALPGRKTVRLNLQTQERA